MAATAPHAKRSSGLTPIGWPRWYARRSAATGIASIMITIASSVRLAIMNTTPPKLVGIWAAFSVSNWG